MSTSIEFCEILFPICQTTSKGSFHDPLGDRYTYTQSDRCTYKEGKKTVNITWKPSHNERYSPNHLILSNNDGTAVEVVCTHLLYDEDNIKEQVRKYLFNMNLRNLFRRKGSQ